MAGLGDKPQHAPYYRRKAKARQLAAQQAAFARAEGFSRRLTGELARVDICLREMSAIIAELAHRKRQNDTLVPHNNASQG